MSKPVFSIIIPTLDEEKYLPKLLKDLSQQSFTDFEVIQVDGGSQDKTIAKAQKFQKKLALKTITVDKKNVSFQRNTGAKQAKADWLIFMDADNRIPSYFLLGIKYQLEKMPDTDYFTCWADIKAVSLKDKPIINSINIFLDMTAKIDPAALGALIGVRKSAFQTIQFNENIKYAEDGQLTRDLFHAGFKFKCFREPTYNYSLRRFKKEGLIKAVRTFAQSSINRIRNKNIDANVNYPMLGGTYYETNNLNFLDKLQTFIKNASKKQLRQAKKILDHLKEI